jgi:photosystem II stability/assembly factor-like uncharacterized protein
MNPLRSLLLSAAALSLLAAPARPDWVPLGPDGGFVASLAVDPSRPSVLYAGTFFTGVFKSTDAGATWTWVGAGLDAERGLRPILALAVDPRHPRTVLAGVPDGLFRSRDSGATWSQVSPNLLTAVAAVLFDPQRDRVYAGTASGVFRSTDGGAHWQRLGPAKWVSALAIDPARRFLYAGYLDNTVLRSTDGGASWTAGSGLPQGEDLTALAVDPLHPGTALAGTVSGVYRSLDGGLTWRRSKGISGPALAFAVWPSNRRVFVAVEQRGVFVSTDGGSRWQASPGQPADPLVRTLAASPAAVYAGTQGLCHPPGGVFRSANGGASWSLRIRGLSTVQVSSLALFARDASHLDVYAAAGLLGLLRSRDGGTSWQRLVLGAQDVGDAAVEPRAGLPPRLYAVSTLNPSSFFRSDDGGATWQVPGNLPPGAQIFRLVRDPRAPGALWASGGSGLFHTADAGTTWTQAPLEERTALRPYLFDVVPDVRDPRTIWASGYAVDGLFNPFVRAFRSTDGGETWDRIDAGLPERSEADVVQNPFEPETLYAATEEGLYRSTDDGASWSLIPALGKAMVSAIGFTPSAVWANVWGVGPYRSADGLTGWELDAAGLTSRITLRLVPDPRNPERLFAATMNGGVFVHAEP